MDKFIGMGLQSLATLILALGSAAKDAFAVFIKRVINGFEADVAVNVAKFAYGVWGCSVFGAVKRSAGKKRCQLCYG